jgi:glyoxylase-like metal-dependent hydrolase (beta-lactamase superfamily II)
LTNIAPAQLDEALAKSFLTSPYQMSVNCFLINTGDRLILIDTGLGNLPFLLPPLRAGYGTKGYGDLLTSLKAVGYQPEQIDEVYITHMHPDHLGGLMNGDTLAFPNAIVRMDKREAHYWLAPANMEKAPEDPRFQSAVILSTPCLRCHADTGCR